MIDNYKKETIYGLLYTVGFSLFIVVMDFFSEHFFWSTLIILIVGRFLYDLFYKLLITDVETENDLITIVHYSIVFGKEEMKIKLEDIEEMKSKSADQITIVINGENGPVHKKFYNNASPWSEINRKLTELKKLLPTKNKVNA